MLYEIKSISHKNGTPRLDGSYTSYIGRHGVIRSELESDMALWFSFVDETENRYVGEMVTSAVESHTGVLGKTDLIVKTADTIYEFTPVRPKKRGKKNEAME